MDIFTTIIAQSIRLDSLPHVAADSGEVQKAVSIVLSITGAISLLVITVAGFRYVIARGDPQEIATSRNAIIYAMIGLIISASAFIIVNFVIGKL